MDCEQQKMWLQWSVNKAFHAVLTNVGRYRLGELGSGFRPTRLVVVNVEGSFVPVFSTRWVPCTCMCVVVFCLFDRNCEMTLPKDRVLRHGCLKYGNFRFVCLCNWVCSIFLFNQAAARYRPPAWFAPTNDTDFIQKMSPYTMQRTGRTNRLRTNRRLAENLHKGSSFCRTRENKFGFLFVCFFQPATSRCIFSTISLAKKLVVLERANFIFRCFLPQRFVRSYLTG